MKYIKLFEQYIENDYYDVVYASSEGHDSIKVLNDFEEAIKLAIRFKISQKDEDIDYIGIESNTDDFAIIFITQKYIDSIDINDFSDEIIFNQFKKAAQECLDTNQVVKSKYVNFEQKTLF